MLINNSPMEERETGGSNSFHHINYIADCPIIIKYKIDKNILWC